MPQGRYSLVDLDPPAVESSQPQGQFSLADIDPPAVDTRSASTTSLSPSEETQFRSWVARNKITDLDSPHTYYDYRGLWKQDPSFQRDGKDGHFPDTYKQPGHPTFSNESIYATPANPGGRWEGETFIPPGFDEANNRDIERLNSLARENNQQVAEEERRRNASLAIRAGQRLDPPTLGERMGDTYSLPGFSGAPASVPFGASPVDIPAVGAVRAVKAIPQLSTAAGQALTQGPSQPSTETIKAGRELIEGVFQASTPAVVAGGLVAPAATAQGLLEAWLASKFGENVAKQMGASEDAQALAGDIAALGTGVRSARGIGKELALKAGKLVEQSRATALALQLNIETAQGLAGKMRSEGTAPMGRPDVPGVRFEQTMESPKPYGTVEGIQKAVEAVKLGQEAPLEVSKPTGQRPPATQPRDVVSSPEAIRAQAERVSEMRQGQPVNVEVNAAGEPVRVIAEPVGQFKAEDVEPSQTAAKIEAARAEVNTEPTEAQKFEGNYKKGHVTIQGLPITIENPKGTERTGKGPDGEEWSVTMPADYGYVKRSEGADGEHVDVYIGPNPDSEKVFIVDQNDLKTGKWDEHKPVLGADSEAEARALYEGGFSDGKGAERIGGVTEMSVPEFKDWLKGDTTKPLAESVGQPTLATEVESPNAADVAETAVDSARGEATGEPGRPAIHRVEESLAPAAVFVKSKTSKGGYYKSETPAEFVKRRESHYNDVFASVLDAAKRVDPSVDPAAVRHEFDYRVTVAEELDNDYQQTQGPRKLLEAIAKYGGLSEKAEKGGYSGELKWLRESPANGPFGSYAGVKGVFQTRATNSDGQASSGLSLDDMARMLSQDPEFHIDDIDGLIGALEDVARAGGVAARGTLPGTRELRQRAGIHPDQAWWKQVEPVDESDSWLSDLEAVDDDFDPSKFGPEFAQRRKQEGPSLFDEAPKADVLSTGEQQPRLPGAENVRDQNVQAPEFEAPFSLTSEASQRKGVNRPLFSEAQRDTDTPEFKRFFRQSKVVNEDSSPRAVYHGTKRGDRVGNRFRKTRATSGPMAFFTTDKPIATKYSEGKEDTSLEHPDDYAGWFTFKPKGARTPVDLDRAWHFITPEQRFNVIKRLPTVGYENSDEASGPIVADSDSIASKDHVDYLLKEARGNGLKAAKELWLNSGSLFDDEEKFFDVLKALGLGDMFEWNSPWKTVPKVYEVYLSIQKPLVTSEIPQAVVDALEKKSRRQRAQRDGSDIWDKRRRDPREWIKQLKDDISTGANSHAWTSIPDWVTDVLKDFGYDGIHDTGGKMGGEAHEVWIPFDDKQVKSATDNRGTYDPNNPNILFSGDQQKHDKHVAELMKTTYADLRSVPISGRQVAILDAGSRFTPDELKAVTNDAAFKRIAAAQMEVLDRVLDTIVGEDRASVEKTGVIFEHNIFGVYLPKPDTDRGTSSQRAVILLNPFEAMTRWDGTLATARKAAEKAYETTVHEALHWHIGVDGPEFDEALIDRLRILGATFANESIARIMEAYATPEGEFRPEVLRLLRGYQGSRRRRATRVDAIVAARGSVEGSAGQRWSERAAPGAVRPSRSQVLSDDTIRRLAEKRGTSPAEERAEAEARGFTVQATLIPGAAAFGDYVLTPAQKKIAELARSEKGVWMSIMLPAQIGVAPTAAGVIRAENAANDQRRERANRVLDGARKMMDGWSHDQSRAFWDAMQGLEPMSSLPADVQPIAKMFKDTIAHWTKTLADHDLLDTYIQHYWPQEWVKPSNEKKLFDRLLGRRPIQGPESYRKQRKVPTTRQGLEWGLEPMSWNPAVQLQRKIYEMSRSLSAREMQKGMIREGVQVFVPSSKPKPEALDGWVRVPEAALGVKYGPSVPTGRVILGNYYAPPEVARLLSNYTSPNRLANSAMFRGYMVAGNASTALLLGWSAFHLLLTGGESIISKRGLVSELLSRGEWKEAAKHGVGPAVMAASAIGGIAAGAPVAAAVGVAAGAGYVIVDQLRKGYKAVHEFYSRDADANEIAGTIGKFVQGGGGFGQTMFEHNDSVRKMLSSLRAFNAAVKRGDLKTAAKTGAKAVGHLPMAAFEAPTQGIMEHWVPYLKASAYLDRAEMELRRLGPGASMDQQRQALGKAWDAIDDRLGQLRYANLFWDNTLKATFMATFLSVGWQVGSIRAGLGAFGQIPRTARKLKEKIEGGGPGGGGKGPGPGGNAPKQQGFPLGPEAWVQPEFAWLLALMEYAVIMAAVYQYLISGKMLGENKDGKTDWNLMLRDAFNPRNGKIDASGREQRVSLISYAKDFYSWSHHPVTTLTHKLKPIIHTAYDLTQNENFYGDAIYDANDEGMQQLWDAMKYVGKSHTPIGFQNAEHLAGPGATWPEQFKEWAKVQVIPFTPASAAMERSDAEEYLHSLIPPSHRTKDEAAKADARRKVRAAMQEGDQAKAIDAAKATGVSRKSMQAIGRSIRQGPLRASFARTSWPEAAKAMSLATEEERAVLRLQFIAKARKAFADARTQAEKDSIRKKVSEFTLPAGQPTGQS